MSTPNEQPWEEAIKAAKLYDKPILLTIGGAPANDTGETFIRARLSETECPGITAICEGAAKAIFGNAPRPLTALLLPTCEPFFAQGGAVNTQALTAQAAQRWQSDKAPLYRFAQALSNVIVIASEGSEGGAFTTAKQSTHTAY